MEGPPGAKDRGGDRDTGRQWEAGKDRVGVGRQRDRLREIGEGRGVPQKDGHSPDPHLLSARSVSGLVGVGPWGPS